MTPLPSIGPSSFRYFNWDVCWDWFLGRHACWWNDITSKHESMLMLPSQVIDALSRSRPPQGQGRAVRRIISEEQENAERDFTALCQSRESNVLGVSSIGSPIPYPFLDDAVAKWRVADAPPNMSDWLGPAFSDAQRIAIAIRQSRMVHASWLVQQSEFWRQLQMLWDLGERKCVRLDGMQPYHGFSLRAVARASDGSHLRNPQFSRILATFARDWQISAFATRDLPIPQSPLIDMPNVFGADGWESTSVRDGIPNFIPPQRLFGDWKTVWQNPRPDFSLSKDYYLQNELPTCANILRIYVVERAIRSRFDPMPHGLKGRMISGLSELLGLDATRVDRLRRRLQLAF